MRKLISITAAIAALGTIAIPSIAAADTGYNVPATASDSGSTHGTFGYLGAQGERFNLGQGDNMDTHLGANPATGLSNASVMGKGTPVVHAVVTPKQK